MTDEIGQAKKASEPMLSKPSGSEIDSIQKSINLVSSTSF